MGNRDEGPGYNISPESRESREDGPGWPGRAFLDDVVAEPTTQEDTDVKFSRNTSITGAVFGSATGAVLVWLIEEFTKVDVPSAIEGAILVIVTGLIALVYPESAER